MCNNNETQELFAPFTEEDVAILGHLVDVELHEGTLWEKEDVEALQDKIRGYWSVVFLPIHRQEREKQKRLKRERRLDFNPPKDREEQEAAKQIG